MKRLTIAATVILAGVIAYTVVGHAQPPGGGKADPVKVYPKHYKVEFENDKVRVLRISYAAREINVAGPGPATPLWPYCRDRAVARA